MKETVVQTILEVAKNQPQKNALLHKHHGRYMAIRYKELARQIYLSARALSAEGIQKGDRVAILANNGPEWVIADLGAQYIGAITVPIHTTLSAKIIQYILEHSGARLIAVAGKSQLEKVKKFQHDLPDLKTVVYIDDGWDEFIKQGKKIRPLDIAPISHDDLCSIIYTSGTTGLPKGVALTHRNFLSNIQAATDAVPVNCQDVFLSFLPLSHIFERTIGYFIPLAKGATIAYAESFKELKKNIQEVRPTILIAVPRVFEKMHAAIWDKIQGGSPLKKKLFVWALKQKAKSSQRRLADFLVFRKIRNSLGGRIRLAISGGAALDEKLGKFFNKVGVCILEGYGLTETSPVVSVNRENKKVFGSVGIVLNGVEVKIAKDKEILVRGPALTQGYYKDTKATDEAIEKDGWFHTGDLGFMNSDGFLFIIGRRKEMIVTAGGKNIWPTVIENALNNTAAINQSMVIGHGRKYVTALIAPKGDATRQKIREAIDAASEEFADYEKIVDFVILNKEFCQEDDELTPTLKLRRETIAKHYQKEIENMYIKPLAE